MTLKPMILLKPACRAVLLLAYIVLLVEAVRVAAAWWSGQLSRPGIWDATLAASLPALVWIWWRHFSPFGRSRGQCLLPDEPAPAPHTRLGGNAAPGRQAPPR